MEKKRICLDAGHYGKYNAGVVSGYYESLAVWKLTQYEKEYLENMGIEVVLTRGDINDNPDLLTRGKMAEGCDLFISNHTNACATESVSRVEAIYLVNREDTFIDDRSREFAAVYADTICKVMGVDGTRIYSKKAGSDRDGNGRKDDNYYGVLNGCFLAGVPGIIAEHSYHTNVAACRWLMDDNNLRRLAKVCAECVATFLGVPTEGDQLQDKPADELYRVRTSWDNTQSQIGAFHSFERAKELADLNSGYSVFNGSGVRVYPEDTFLPYVVRVSIRDLHMRLEPTIDAASVGYVPVGAYTIVEEKQGKVGRSGTKGLWGRLKTEQFYNGKNVPVWICLSYTERV